MSSSNIQTAVAYARFSHDSQREESITAQLRAIRTYAERQGILILREYTDEARSATTDNRPGFLRMINDIKSKAVRPGLVLVHKFDRFARNRYDSAIYRKALKDHNARLVAVDQPLDDSPESILTESLLEGLAEYYSRNLAREVMKGLRENALQGRHCGGRPPLGYSVDKDGRYVIDEAEAGAVRLIFDLYSRGYGYGYGRIIEELNVRGHRTKRGTHFGKNSIYEILRNEKYAGIFTYNRRQTEKPKESRNNHKHKPTDEVIRVPGAMPAIIEEGVFKKVQEVMDGRRHQSERARQKAKHIYLLSGLIYCGQCGTAYVATSTTAKGHWYGYYECGKKDRAKSCTGRIMPKDELEEKILEKIQSGIFSSQARKKLAQKVIDYGRKNRLRFTEESSFTEAEYKKVIAIIDNLVRAVEEGRATPRLLEQLSQREEQAELLKREVETAKVKSTVDFTPEIVITYLEKMELAMMRGSDEDRKEVAQQFVDRVIIYEDHVDVVLKIVLDADGGP